MSDTAGRNQPVMPPGRELDAEAFNAEVAEKVMGWKSWKQRADGWWWQDVDGLRCRLPDFLHDWDAMRLVVERMVALGCHVAMDVGPKGSAWCAVITNPDTEFDSDDRDVFNEQADALPHAVALAARKAATSAQQGAEASRE